MSKSITEKELADKLREECDVNRSNGWNHAARKIAKAMGVPLAPERPEPGTWHFTRKGSQPAYVDHGGDLTIITTAGPLNYDSELDVWPDLDPATPPARVVPAEPVELAESDVCAIHNEHGRGRYFEDFSIEDRNGLLATVNAARRKLLEASK